MIPLLTREAVREIDRDAIERLLVPGIVLMENAGAFAARLLCERFRGELHACVILGGIGQNGGDAWVVARHLINLGITPRVLLAGAEAKVQGDALTNLHALRAMGATIELIEQGRIAELRVALGAASVIVDGLFGTGLDRAIEGVYAEVVDAINTSEKPVFALDLPSGIDANTGAVLGCAVRAKVTATFAAHKRGLHQYPGVEFAGEVVCGSIGVPSSSDFATALVERADVAKLLPLRRGDAHKGSNGHVLGIAGSPGKTGAAMLSALGALRAGAGLMTVATQPEARRALDAKVVEVMTAELVGDASSAALELVKGKDAAFIGPGLGLDEPTRALSRALAVSLPVPCVIDADALTAIGEDIALLRHAVAPRVLTPHPGEAARLLGVTTAEVQRDRYAAASALAERSAQVVVLKGARTVTASPGGELRVSMAATSALGTAGTGDVLCGVISALLCALPAFEAAFVAVHVHALAGLRAAKADRGLIASEVAASIPAAVHECQTFALS